MRASAIAASLFALTTAGSASAADNGRFAVHGAGALECAKYVYYFDNGDSSDEAKDKATQMLTWAEGYVTRFNRATEKTYDIFGSLNNRDMATWLYIYCKSNLGTDFSEAVDAMTISMWTTRTEKSPK